MCGATDGDWEQGMPGERDYFSMATPSSQKVQPWCDGYSGQADIVIEDFAGSIEYRILLRMLDEYKLQMPVKGGFVAWAPERIWISSNLHPRDWYPSNNYDGGPLERRLELDRTGTVIELTGAYPQPDESGDEST